jgi:hypothetical protein
MVTYQRGETVVLTGTVTPDASTDLIGITATVTVLSGKVALLSDAGMTLNETDSTDARKIFYYYYTIPSSAYGTLVWRMKVIGDGGYATIEQGNFVVE